VTVVDFAQQTKVLDRRFASNREGDDVVELEEAARRTAPMVCAHEGAAPEVAQPDCSLDLGRNMPRAGSRRTTRLRMLTRRELLLRQVLQEDRQCPVEDLCEIPGGHRVPADVLRKLELVE